MWCLLRCSLLEVPIPLQPISIGVVRESGRPNLPSVRYCPRFVVLASVNRLMSGTLVTMHKTHCITEYYMRYSRYWLKLSLFLQVQLTIRTLPELPSGAKYKCVFGKAEPIDAVVTPMGLSCSTPGVAGRPGIPESRDHVLVPLSVRSSETNKDFVSRNFAYYDCDRHTTCMDCVKSQWACNWCVYENTCTHNTTSCQRTVISGENVSILHMLQQVFSTFIFSLYSRRVRRIDVEWSGFVVANINRLLQLELWVWICSSTIHSLIILTVSMVITRYGARN